MDFILGLVVQWFGKKQSMEKILLMEKYYRKGTSLSHPYGTVTLSDGHGFGVQHYCFIKQHLLLYLPIL